MKSPGTKFGPGFDPGRLRSAPGFTLIEVVIVTVIMAILAAIAIPQYTGYVKRAKRAEAKRVLSEAAQVMERNYTVSGCYAYSTPLDCNESSPSGSMFTLSGGLTRAPSEGKASYLVKFSALDKQTFTLQAVPCGSVSGDDACAAPNDGFTDSECGSFTLTHTGVRGVSVATEAAVVAACWQR
jgi:type IV pilus assembly protein PilE